MSENQTEIRNFCIIAHIDHGKSTLADRFLEITDTISKREMQDQVLDQMDIERERGITIKLQPVQMKFRYRDIEYQLNLIDTPGHVDFTYEVSRSLACVEGAILVVDASQGIEAQTLANLYLALEQNLTIIPVINKIDLPNTNIERVKKELINILGVKENEILLASAKKGTGIKEILQTVIEKVPAPRKPIDKDKTQALIFDSLFDTYQGVIAFVRVFSGSINKSDRIVLLQNQATSELTEVGIFKPMRTEIEKLAAGQIGYLVTGLRDLSLCRVGDTISLANNQGAPLAGYKKVAPMIFASFYPQEADHYRLLKDALEKLILNDSALVYEPENSPALGFGFRLGFLGLLHMEIVQERLEREYGLNLIATAPSVTYQYKNQNGELITIKSPVELPSADNYIEVLEPWVKLNIFLPSEFLGPAMELLQNFRCRYERTEYLEEKRVLLTYEAPLSTIITRFYDQLKSASKGYASMNYEFLEWRAGDLERVDILVAQEKVPPLSFITIKSQATNEGRSLLKRLKKIIPKQLFQISLQAAVGAKVLAREDIPALRKDVTAKLYGGDVTRKRKLLEKQKAGKKRMKHIGKVDIPQDAFLALLKK